MSNSLTYSESILVAAAPEDVYAVVSDVTRTGEWSPVCKECWWDEGEPGTLGSFFIGRNVTPDRTWETRSEVVMADQGRAFAWSVREGNVLWGYSMRATSDGTELTESWEFTPKGQAYFAELFGSEAPAEIEKRRQAARAGIPATLQAIQRIVEQR